MGKYYINLDLLEQIVDDDEKSRYRFNDKHSKIKACQGHSIPWVVPELIYIDLSEFLYHDTTVNFYKNFEKR